LQFHPEVTHSGAAGKALLHNFVVNICKAPTDWDMRSIADKFIQQVLELTQIAGGILLILDL